MESHLKSLARRLASPTLHLVRRSAIGLCVVVAALTAGCDKPGAAKADKPGGEAGEKKPAHAHGGGEEGGEGHVHGEHEDEVKLTPEAIQANRVRVAAAEKKVLVSTLTAPARLGFNTEQVAHVGSILKGRVSEMKVRLGDTVRKGDPLVIVDSSELGEAQSDYLQKLVAAEISKPAIELAKNAHERAQQLYDKNQGISLTELQKRLGEYQTAQGAAGAATAALTASDNRLQLLGMTTEAIQTLGKTKQLSPKYTIVAPIDGQVVEREATLGELVSPEKEHLLTLADVRTVWVFADVPEARLAEVAVGAKAKVTVAASQGDAVEGTVSYILPQLDATTRTGRVRIEVKNEQFALRPGMFATAEITTSTSDGVVVVPDAAVQTVEGEPAVFVPHPKEANTFVKRQVGVGPAVDGMVPVFAGLKEGERYVASGSFILKAQIGKEGAAHEH